jgi:hypothetical protein
MSAFKLHTLKQKLWVIVAASFIARVIMFFVLPNTPSFLGPDEGTYASLTKWIGESKPASEFPAYGKGLYLSGRAMIVPASVFYRAGVNELDAVRLVASIYGFCTLAMVVLMILKLCGFSEPRGTNQVKNENLIAAMILIFAFLPSHFVWSNLGLRESATEFWLITTFIAFFVIFHHKKKITVPSLLVLTGSIVFTFSSRPQVGWVLGVAIIAYLTCNVKQVNTYFALPAVLCAVVLGSALNLGSTGSTPNLGSTGSTPNLGSTGSTPNLGSTGSTAGRIFSPLFEAGEIVEYKQEVNQLDAASVIKTQSCPRETPSLASAPPTKFDTYFCIVWRAPYMVSTFLFRPILGVDVTSTSSLLAAFENLIWVGFFLTVFGLIIRRRRITFLNPLLPTIIFLSLYVLGASAYQGNMGTGFRHKSLILWAVLLVIFALAWRKSPGINRQKARFN